MPRVGMETKVYSLATFLYCLLEWLCDPPRRSGKWTTNRSHCLLMGLEKQWSIGPGRSDWGTNKEQALDCLTGLLVFRFDQDRQLNSKITLMKPVSYYHHPDPSRICLEEGNSCSLLNSWTLRLTKDHSLFRDLVAANARIQLKLVLEKSNIFFLDLLTKLGKGKFQGQVETGFEFWMSINFSISFLASLPSSPLSITGVLCSSPSFFQTGFLHLVENRATSNFPSSRIPALQIQRVWDWIFLCPTFFLWRRDPISLTSLWCLYLWSWWPGRKDTPTRTLWLEERQVFHERREERSADGTRDGH